MLLSVLCILMKNLIGFFKTIIVTNKSIIVNCCATTAEIHMSISYDSHGSQLVIYIFYKIMTIFTRFSLTCFHNICLPIIKCCKLVLRNSFCHRNGLKFCIQITSWVLTAKWEEEQRLIQKNPYNIKMYNYVY